MKKTASNTRKKRRPQRRKTGRTRLNRAGMITALVLAACLPLAGISAFYYARYSNLIDDRLSGKLLRVESRIFSAPRRIAIGENLSPDQLAAYLKSAGYTTVKDAEAAGQITVADSSIEIKPSENSYFAGKNALAVDFAHRRISRLRSLHGGERLMSAEIEPEIITGFFDRSREKRRMLRYENIPPLLRKAVIITEDKRFFDHPGFDPIRIIGAAWVDVRRRELAQGASTITMQTARSFFFSTKRQWRRKIQETVMALMLEHRFSKEQIFELYANEVYLGNRGSFAIHGFGEAAMAYFGKDLRELDLGQYCFLAGIIHAPNRYSSSERRPERSAEARDRVIALMENAGHITAVQAREAEEAPLGLIAASRGAGSAGHFVDMVLEELSERFPESDMEDGSYNIYTTLDTALQRAAIIAVDEGMKSIDARLKKMPQAENGPLPQVALVALDPRSGEIKALVGSRDYAHSQLNRTLARRQPGSVFKPFVYAAAFETAIERRGPRFTPLSTVIDEPTVFRFDGGDYEPGNYGRKYQGNVTLREALAQSLNIATVKVAEETGYDRVVRFAERTGIRSAIRPTPALALGAYEMTPLDVAGGYTIFAANGTRSEPFFLKRVRRSGNGVILDNRPQRRAALDPRVAYLVTNILEDVVTRGTGTIVRSRGFTLPAAGKTGTSHDGWFAGYTTSLLCVVWVGFDDNRELNLSGAASAGLIWTEFMKKAARLPAYADPGGFIAPAGVISMTIDAESLMPARPECPVAREEVFIAGTEPDRYCTLHGGGFLEKIRPDSWLRRLFRRGS